MSQTQNQKNQKPNEVSSDLQERVNRNQYIIDGLRDNGAWVKVIEDVEQQRKRLDDRWQYVSDPAKMNEFRITKMAVMKVINLLSDYEFDMKQAQEVLSKINNTETNIPADVDN